MLIEGSSGVHSCDILAQNTGMNGTFDESPDISVFLPPNLTSNVSLDTKVPEFMVENNYQETFTHSGANAWSYLSGAGILVFDTNYIVSLINLFGRLQLLFDS